LKKEKSPTKTLDQKIRESAEFGNGIKESKEA
jgi:hypothetical protein